MKACCFIILASFLSGALIAQEGEFSGYLMDCESKLPVVAAVMHNESTRRAYVTNEDGRFSFEASPGDTLAIMSLSYEYLIYYVSGDSIAANDTICLKPRIYDIPEAMITLPSTYKGFKKAVLDYQPPEKLIPELPTANTHKTPALLDTNYLSNWGMAVTSPASFFYYKFSKREKSNRKAYYAMKRFEQQNRVDQKFNRELITELTGLEGDSLTNFIGYCNFSHNYLFSASQLEIIQQIALKFEKYQKEVLSANNTEGIKDE